MRILNPSTTYHWKFTYGPEIRLVVREGGMAGSALYDYGLPAPRGRYDPSPHVAYLGAPIDRSGAASASIAGTIYPKRLAGRTSRGRNRSAARSGRGSSSP